MSKQLLSVGIDVGTTTTQVIFSRLTAQNRASAYSVPEMVIENREVICKGDVHFTPLLDNRQVDGEKLRCLVAEEYEKAGVCRENVDTGAIIITGETSRKENAAKVSRVLASFAGDFVVATAGPHLESVLAAKGAGAVEYSRKMGKKVLHMDIGGGTSNLAWIEDGIIMATGCMNVGGRLLKIDESGTLTYISPVLKGIFSGKVGGNATREQVEALTDVLVRALEMAAGLRTPGPELEKLWTGEAGDVWQIPQGEFEISFSGGVADCIREEKKWLEFGDIGPELGRKIRGSWLCRGQYRLGSETIRATVIGAGCHSLQLSGSTVYVENVDLPKKNLPVVHISGDEQDRQDLQRIIARKLQQQDEECILALPGYSAPAYRQVVDLGEKILEGFGERPVLVALERDMAKALGQVMGLRTTQPILCVDGVYLPQESYLDVGEKVGSALALVVKSLIMEKE